MYQMTALCKNCGHTYGDHGMSDDNCPSPDYPLGSWEYAETTFELLEEGSKNVVIIPCYTGFVEWLSRRGITGRVIAGQVTADDVRSKRVYGVLPLHLAAVAAELVVVDMPGIPLESRGWQDLTADELDAAGATLVAYQVFARGPR